MNPWLRFWFPHHDADEGGPAPRDAALWSPKAIADTQRELWRHAAQATHDWWSYWRALWPAVPVQPPAGVVMPPPEPREAADAEGEHDPSAPVERRRRPRAARSHGGATPTQRARHTARGK